MLADNGGSTQTHALLAGSPAINAGNSANPGSGSPACELTDQRGYGRPDRCDIGAYEYNALVQPIALTPVSLPSGTVGVGYSQQISASGGNGSFSFAVTNGTLPTGLTLGSTGVLAGIPSAAGSFTFTVSATDGSGLSSSRQYSVTFGKGSATTTITADTPDPSNVGQAVTVKYTVTAGAGTPTGNVTVSDGTASCTGTVAAGQCDITFASAGNKTLTASYGGDTNFNASSSVSEPHSVNVPNSAPVATNDSFSTNEDTATTINVLGNDSDPDGDTLTVIKLSDPSHGTVTLNANGTFTYTPADNYNGSDSFTYKVNDGTVDSNVATVTITVNAINDAPLANGQSMSTDEDTAKGMTLTASDVDSSGLTYIVVSSPAHGTLSGTAPNLTYTPAADYSGPDSFTFKANDGQADSNVATFTVNVNPVVTPPVTTGVVFTSAGHGAWAPTGPDTAVFSIIVLGSYGNGVFFGTATGHAAIRLGSDGQSFTGDVVWTVADPDGNALATFPGTFQATRIVAEAPG